MNENKTKKAGAIILSNLDSSNILLLHSGKEKDWQFPKGHVEDGENYIDAMYREVKEETGLDVEILSELPNHEYFNDIDGDIILKMWCVKSKDDSKLKKEFETDNLIWFHYDEVADILTYDTLKKYYNEVLPIISSFF
jgi:8-oxo-dGTP pyrophosphatase MutT (NUDIX family)